MAGSRYRPEGIMSLVRQAEFSRRQGLSRADANRQVGISGVAYCRRRKEYGGTS